MNTRKLCLLVALQLPFLLLYGQLETEGGLFIGAAVYQGDLSPSPFAASEARPTLGGVYRYWFTPHFALRGTATWARISGDDRNRVDFQPGTREWSMTNTLLELALHSEWHFFEKDRYSNTGLINRQYSPFISFGLGGTFTNLKLKVPPDDRLKIPEPEAKKTFIVLPISIGMRFDVNEDFLISAEFGTRCTFSDYIDGVSLNGNPKKDDWYFFTGLSFVYVIDEIVGGKLTRWR